MGWFADSWSSEREYKRKVGFMLGTPSFFFISKVNRSLAFQNHLIKHFLRNAKVNRATALHRGGGCRLQALVATGDTLLAARLLRTLALRRGGNMFP